MYKLKLMEVIKSPKEYIKPLVGWPDIYPPKRNKLILGDNIEVMQALIEQGCKIDLIYIDPPYFSNATYKVGDKTVFTDKWDSMTSYLNYMRERLVLMKELLTKSGSIYVHLDWHASHYVKVMMDEIFGINNFRNEIVWAYRSSGASNRTKFSRKHDTILFYSKSTKPKFNALKERIYYKGEFFTTLRDSDGRYYADVNLRDVLQDEIILVTDKLLKVSVKPVLNVSKEHLYFDTQKPEGLLQILIMATTDSGDIVADFFCGSGTTLAVAEKLNRRWIGCDISELAIETTKKRLLEIDTSKALNISNMNLKYTRPVKPFEMYLLQEQGG